MAGNKSHHMEVNHRGDLEDITRPSSNKVKDGSRVTSGASLNALQNSTGRFKSGTSYAPSMELLTPQEVMERDFDLDLEDIASESDEDDDDVYDYGYTGRSSAMFDIAEPRSHEHDQSQTVDKSLTDVTDDDILSRQLTLFGDDTDEDLSVCSEEERDIIKEIRNEVTKQVKEDMKEELAIYQEVREKIKKKELQDEDADLEELEPRIREAIRKMRKLDKVLAKKIRREKTVKRERIQLQKKLRDDLNELNRSTSVTHEEQKNTEKFLALTLPPSHNIGVELKDDVPPTSHSPVDPVFQTQPPEEDINTQNHPSSSADSKTSAASRVPGRSASGAASSTQSSSVHGSQTSAQQRHKKKKEKDFIKRNVELASDAASTIAMTDDEKKLVEDLLHDLDDLPDIPEQEEQDQAYQLVTTSGEGFRPVEEDASRLQSIDSRLKVLLPPEDFQAICNTPTSTGSSAQLFTRTLLRHSDIDIDELGEQALRETKEHREFQKRLKDIEQDLEQMSQAVDDEIASPTLSSQQLEQLLDDCARTMSRATAETDSLSQTARSGMTSIRSSLYENTPKLPDDVLQQLLVEARHSLGAPEKPQLTTTDDDKVESVSEDTIQRLLLNSRATSRMAGVTVLSPTPSSSHALRDVSHISIDSSPTHSRLDQHHGSFTSIPKQPFLPQIDPTGMLSTQRQTSSVDRSIDDTRSCSSVSRMSVVYNSFTDSDVSARLSQETPTPRPPSGTRKSSAGKNSRSGTQVFYGN